jgi:UTP--glucose-1-phosphate uridylyltransferase
MDIDIAIVPVAGLGTRLLPATKSQPKEMLPVGRKPVVQYVVEELTRVGLKRVLFITGPGKASIENHFDLNGELIQTLRESGKEDLLAELEYERATVQYFYTRQRQLLGLGHAVLCARSFVGSQPFVVALGDSIIGMHAESDVVERMTRCFREKQAAAVIAFEEVPPHEVAQYGIAQPKNGAARPGGADGELFEIEDLIEKPSPREAPSNLAIAARYVLSPAIFDALADTRRGKGGEIQLTDAIRAVIRGGGKAYGVRLRQGERRYDIGNFQAYFEAFVEFALADPKFGPDLRRYLEDMLHVSHA